MKIENLSKELSTAAMTEVKGGISLTDQVVPTNVQSNELAQGFSVYSSAPVSIGNDAEQSNCSNQSTFSPVGSLIISVPRCRS
jgi:hypothetical protein